MDGDDFNEFFGRQISNQQTLSAGSCDIFLQVVGTSMKFVVPLKMMDCIIYDLRIYRYVQFKYLEKLRDNFLKNFKTFGGRFLKLIEPYSYTICSITDLSTTY